MPGAARLLGRERGNARPRRLLRPRRRQTFRAGLARRRRAVAGGKSTAARYSGAFSSLRTAWRASELATRMLFSFLSRYPDAIQTRRIESIGEFREIREIREGLTTTTFAPSVCILHRHREGKGEERGRREGKMSA